MNRLPIEDRAAQRRDQAAQALAHGETFLAYDLAAEGLEEVPGDARLLQLQALALARSGSPHQAALVLRRLQAAGHRDEETLGLLARTHKDLWRLAADPAEREAEGRRGFALYEEAFRAHRGCYSGVNAAAMALLLGETDLARSLAREVVDLCDDPGGRDGGDYWREASRGEAALIAGDVARAAEHYQRAGQLGRGRDADVASTRRQARLLCGRLFGEPGRLDACFAVATVVAFAGHRPDAPDRPAPRFPPGEEARVRGELDALLAEVGAGIGYCAAASGADLLFIEAMLARGAEVHIVLPLPEAEFRRESVEGAGGGDDWGQRFDEALVRAASVTRVDREASTDPTLAFEFGNRLLSGLARIRARALDSRVVPVAVWDGGTDGDGPGGTAAFCALWQALGATPRVVDPRPNAGRVAAAAASAADGARGQAVSGLPQVIRALLFADVAGYGKLTDRLIPAFVEHFLGRAASLLGGLPEGDRPLFRNTWGDAFYLVFRTVGAAGRAALDLRDLVADTDWTTCGLPAGLRLRIGLHAGPVFACVDPVLGQPTFTGFHVSRTARIEPITEEGQIFVSQAFAALAETEPDARPERPDFVCDYVGRRVLPKRAGVFPFYLLRRRGGGAGEGSGR